jgi:hypothetical protein
MKCESYVERIYWSSCYKIGSNGCSWPVCKGISTRFELTHDSVRMLSLPKSS